jgi:hypothetical protein
MKEKIHSPILRSERNFSPGTARSIHSKKHIFSKNSANTSEE